MVADYALLRIARVAKTITTTTVTKMATTQTLEELVCCMVLFTDGFSDVNLPKV